MSESLGRNILFVILSWILSFAVTWWFVSEFSLYFFTLSTETKMLIYIPLATNFALISSYYFLSDYWRNDSQSWQLVKVLELCALSDVSSEMAQKAETISLSVVSNVNAAGNASEKGLVFSFFLIQCSVYTIASWPTSGNPLWSLSGTLSLLLITIILIYGWVYTPQKEYGIFKYFWNNFWRYALHLVAIQGQNAGFVANQGIPSDYFWMDIGLKIATDEEVNELKEMTKDIKCNPLSFDPDEENYDDTIYALFKIKAAKRILSSNKDIIDEAKARSSVLRDSVDFFENHMDVVQCYRDGTIEKHLEIIRGLGIIAICPEAFNDLEAIRENGKLVDNLEALSLITQQQSEIENLPLIAIPSSIKVYIAIVFAVLALLPFTNMILTLLTANTT